MIGRSRGGILLLFGWRRRFRWRRLFGFGRRWRLVGLRWVPEQRRLEGEVLVHRGQDASCHLRKPIAMAADEAAPRRIARDALYAFGREQICEWRAHPLSDKRHGSRDSCYGRRCSRAGTRWCSRSHATVQTLCRPCKRFGARSIFGLKTESRETPTNETRQTRANLGSPLASNGPPALITTTYLLRAC